MKHYTTEPVIRQAFITGLRNLADYLDQHPAVPVPKYDTDINLSAASADDGGCAQVTQFARHTGATLDNRLAGDGHYDAARAFGPLCYRMIAISETAMARHRASGSYYGCVTPDPVTDTWT